MQKKQSQENELIPEPIFTRTAAQCFLMFERYRLKTHIIGSNIGKEIIKECYDSLQGRITERYTNIFEHLKNEINNLQKNFIIAQASNLRTLNNILRDYRRRVGTLANQPLSNFKYNKYDRFEKILLQSLVYNDRENYEQILQFREELTISMQQGDKEIAERYRPNQKIKENYEKMLEVVDKTECYCYKYYENFERSMMTTVNSLESYFQKLNTFLTIWENVGSTKAYQAKSQKQKEMDQKVKDSMYNRRFFQEETQQNLQQLYNNSPPNSSQKQQYRKRLNDLRRQNAQKQKKMDMVGKMFNKRKNRAGILVSRYRDLSVMDWYFNIEGNRAPIKYLDEFKNYTAQIQNTQNQFKPTGYELQKPFKKQKIDDIKQHMLRNQTKSQMNHEWRYDKYGKDGVFDLIDCGSQLVQKRIQFQITRQVELQNSDDRRKRELLEKQNLHTREIERKEGLHIGFLHFQENEEMEWLQNREYDTEYLPQMYVDNSSDSLQFSDEQNTVQKCSKTYKIQKQNKLQQQQQQIEQPQQIQSQKAREMIPLVRLGNEKKQKQTVIEHKDIQYQQQIENKSSDDRQFEDMEVQQQIITSFFKQYSLKVLRKESQPTYKQAKFLYFQTIQQIKWHKVSKYFECEKIFVSTKNTIIYLNHIFSKNQKIKGSIYTLDQEMQQQVLKQKIAECFANKALVTIKMYPIYTQLEENSISAFMIGLLLILLKENQMPEDYGIKDYIYAGKQIIEDYNCYYYPQEYKTSHGIYMRHKQNHVSYQNFRNKKQVNSANRSEVASYEGTTTISSKNDTNLYSFSSPQQNTRQIQETQQHYQRKKVQTLPICQQPISQTPYENYRQQKTLKRQNSREYLHNVQPQIPVIKNEQRQIQNAEGEQQDYQSL